MALVPQVAKAVKLPVIAAGGIASGAGVVAALALGAKGALLGTRFVATRESMAADLYKQALVGRDSDATVITDAFTGLYARVLRNTFATEYTASGAPVLPGYVQNRAARDILEAAAARKDGEYYPMWAGQSVGLIHDLPAAADVVRAVVEEARAVLRSLASDVTVA
jgi:nitronate monooxygenase